MRAFFLFFTVLYGCVQAQSILINEFQSKNNKTYLDEFGEYNDWIELYNTADTSVNLQGYFLSDDEDNRSKWSFPNVEIAAHGFLVIGASGEDNPFDFQANFKLSSEGESIFFSNPDLQLEDQVGAVSLKAERSYARVSDGGTSWAVMYTPSPAMSNAGSKEEVNGIGLNIESGFYKEGFYVKSNSAITLRYTLNSETPTSKSEVFPDSLFFGANGPMQISYVPTSSIVQDSLDDYDVLAWRRTEDYFSTGNIVKVRAFDGDLPVSDPVVYSYFIGNFEFSCPVISLVSDSVGLFSFNDGIYVPGTDFNGSKMWSGNYLRKGADSERLASIEFYTKELNLEFKQNIGIRIHGGGSRIRAQKSFRLIADDDYGSDNRFNYPVFSNLTSNEYKHLILRSKFTNWWDRNSMFQDEFVHRLLRKNDINLDLQEDKTVVAYLNGEYWGAHTLRQRQDEFYLEKKYGFERDEVDIINGNYSLIDHGTNEGYEDLVNFILDEDPMDVNYLQVINQQLDLDNYIDYFIVESYFGNVDWPQNNMKLWRSKSSDDPRWRFFFYDLDAGFYKSYFNSFERLDELDNTQARMFNSLMKSDEFRAKYLRRYNYFLNQVFVHWKMLEIVEELYQIHAPLMDAHIARWGNPRTMEAWFDDLDYLKQYLSERSCIVREQLISKYEEQEVITTCLKSDAPHFIIYPNPTQEVFTIQLFSDFFGKNEITIYEMQGRKVISLSMFNGGGLVDVSDLQNGIYLVEVKSDNGEKSVNRLTIK